MRDRIGVPCESSPHATAWSWTTRLRGALTAGVVCASLVGPAAAQQPDKPEKDPVEPLNTTSIREDTEAVDRFLKIEERHAPRGEWSRIARFYQEQLDRNDQGLFGIDGERYLPLTVYCHQRVGKLPPEGLEAYRRRVDPEADRLFEQARSTGDVAPLMELIRRFFNATKGDDAMLLAGVLLMERGQYWEAARALRPLHPSLGAGVLFYPDTTLDLDGVRARLAYALAAQGERSELESLLGRWDPATHFGASTGAAFAKDLVELAKGARATSTAAPDDWPVVYGSAAHANVAASSEQPVGPAAWLLPDTVKRTPFPQYIANNWKPSELPTSQCAVQGDRVYRVGSDGLIGVSLKGGNREWGAPIDDSVDLQNAQNMFGRYIPPDALRYWRRRSDLAGSSLSVAGKWLFSIQCTCPPGLAKIRQAWGSQNILRAYDTTVDQPALKDVPSWSGPGEQREEFKDVYWLATPVALDGRLFIPAQVGGAYWVYGLEQDSLKLLWRTEICGGDAPSNPNNPFMIGDRPGEGSAVAAGQGRVYWVSQNGVVACLDAKNGEKAWVARYWRNATEPGGPTRPKAAAFQPPAQGPWWVTPPIVDTGRLVVAPRDSHMLLCFDAITGEVQWKSPQLTGIRGLAGVREGLVYLIGDRLEAVSLAEGKVMAEGAKFPTGPACGRPVITASEILVPTDNALLAIDLATLAPLRQVDLTALFPPRSAGATPNPPLGNLLMSSGVLVSAHAQGVAAFYSKNYTTRLIEEDTKAIAAAPDDPSALLGRANTYHGFGMLDLAMDDALAACALAQTKGTKRQQNAAQQTLRILTQQLYDTKKDATVLERALGAITNPKNRLPILVALALDHGAHGRADKAREIVRTLERDYPATAELDLGNGRSAQLDCLFEELLRGTSPADEDPARRAELVKAVATETDPARLALAADLAGWDDAAGELRAIAAQGLIAQGKAAEGVTLCRLVARRLPGRPAALGVLAHEVRFAMANQMHERALELLAVIKRDYADVRMPARDLAEWRERWAGAAGGGSGSGPSKDGDHDGSPDGSERAPGPVDGKAFVAEVLGQGPLAGRALVSAPAPARATRTPIEAVAERKLERVKGTLRDIVYQRAIVVGAVRGHAPGRPADEGMDAVAFLVDGDGDGKYELELRENATGDIVWRTALEVKTSAGVDPRRRVGNYNQNGVLFRHLAGPQVALAGERVVAAVDFSLWGIHPTEGKLKWERSLTRDAPHGTKAAPDPRMARPEAVPEPQRLFGADRVVVLTPGGKLWACATLTGEVAWTSQIDRMRQGRMYWVPGQILVLAETGDDSARTWALHRFDEFTGKQIALDGTPRPIGAILEAPRDLGPKGELVLATAARVEAIAAATGRLRWQVTSAGITSCDVLGDVALVGQNGRISVLEVASGRERFSAQLHEDVAVVASSVRNATELFVVAIQGLEFAGHERPAMWISCYELATGARRWQAEAPSTAYLFNVHVEPLDGAACIASAYSLQPNQNQCKLFLPDPSQSRDLPARRQGGGRNQMVTEISAITAARPFAYNGWVYAPTDEGLDVHQGAKPLPTDKEKDK